MTTTLSTEKHWNKAQKDAAPDEFWALPEKKKLRISDAKHTELAWTQVDRVKGLDDAEKKKARKRIQARAKELGIDTSKWKKYKGISKEEFDNTGASFGNTDSVSHLLVHSMTEASGLAHELGECRRSNALAAGDTACLEAISKRVADLKACLALLDEELAELGLPCVTPDAEQCQAAEEAKRDTLNGDFEGGQFYFLEAEPSPPDEDESTEDEG